jgi:hypothetical protein
MKPIILSTPEVIAVLNGTKTMVRKIIDPQPKPFDLPLPMRLTELAEILKKQGKGYTHIHTDGVLKGYVGPRQKYAIGDKLWVREKWKPNELPTGWPYHYYAGNDTFTNPDNERWYSSLSMPIDAARIFLKVTDIRAEKLQDIIGEDIFLEGVIQLGPGLWKNYITDKRRIEKCRPFKSQRKAYRSLWSSIYRQTSWVKNPYVWVISFEKTELHAI